MQAVVKFGPTQYLIKEGMELLVARNAELESVLLAYDGDKVLIGDPTLSEVKVKYEVLGETKGDKVRTSKFKAKSRYHKTVGIRPVFTKLKITAIS